MTGRFGGVLTAMATPFREDLSLDADRAHELAGWLVENGTEGLVVAGSTGESATLTDDEKVTLFKAVVAAVGGRAKVIAGTGTYDTQHSIHLTEAAERVGVDAVLVVSPYYNKPPQRGLLAHFTAVAGATKLPVIVYNIPGRTAVRIEHDTLLRLAEVENIVAVKDSTGDLDAVAKLISEAPEDFDVYCGDDWATFFCMALGGAGVVSVASHLAGTRIARMISLIEEGNLPEARKLHFEMKPLFDTLFITSNPIPLKAALGLVGQPVGPPRLPLVPATEDEITRVKQGLVESGVL